MWTTTAANQTTPSNFTNGTSFGGKYVPANQTTLSNITNGTSLAGAGGNLTLGNYTNQATSSNLTLGNITNGNGTSLVNRTQLGNYTAENQTLLSGSIGNQTLNNETNKAADGTGNQTVVAGDQNQFRLT